MLDGKVAIITGASSGIGRAAAMRFAAAGARLVLNARGETALAQVVDQVTRAGGEAVAVAGDVADAGVHVALVAAALDRFGRLDIGFNNAGAVGPIAPLAQIAPADWQAVIATNLTGAFLGARAQIPAMLRGEGGSILFTSSLVGTSAGLPGMAAYGAAKAGLMGLVRGIAADYGARGIRANALMVGGTRTAMAGDAAQQQWAAGLHALKRIAEPEEIAEAALFLAGGMSSFVTGSALWADGGNAAVKL